MKWNAIYTPGLLVIGLWLGNATTSAAQPGHEHEHGVPKHRPKIHINLFSPQGRPVAQIQGDYRYVVPSTPRFGAYYNYDKNYYYTPPVQTQAGQPEQAPRPTTIEFGASKHLVELSERLEGLTNEFCLELHYNYRHNHGFREVYAEAYQLHQAAKFIHTREHHGDREAVRRAATNIDNLFHHVQDDVSQWERQEHRQIGQLGLEGKTEELQALIHHLLYDIGVKPDHDKDPHEQVPRTGREEAPPPALDAPPRR